MGWPSHQVAVQGLVGDRAQSIHDQGADGDVGDEAPIHNVNMYPVATRSVNGCHLHKEARTYCKASASGWLGCWCPQQTANQPFPTCSPNLAKLADRIEGETCEASNGRQSLETGQQMVGASQFAHPGLTLAVWYPLTIISLFLNPSTRLVA